ncbi:MAG: hypothetical protein KQJ78_12465 [Deltaproteobacteria bacterium]|nr:hypothetical protein [Deltaproteobacteria bacterium]
MRCFVVVFGGGTLLVASSFKSPTHPDLVRRMVSNDVHRMILMEVPAELCQERYPDNYSMALRTLGKDEFRVLDFNGSSVFSKFSFKEMKEPVMVEF